MLKPRVQTLGRVRVDRGPTDTGGRWVNGIYRDCQLTWFPDHGFLYTLSTYYDRKTFEVFEWQESAWPTWSVAKFEGFCAALKSAAFGAFLSECTYRSSHFTMQGIPMSDADGARFEFRWFGSEEILLDMPEIDNGMILEAELYREVRKQLCA
ncbi:MAG: hypothetical protein KBE09_05480 [Candidatus Pacebacteria bacterium]|nr:hypothetical protein [Candidatus Paceibacterota bacterium]